MRTKRTGRHRVGSFALVACFVTVVGACASSEPSSGFAPPGADGGAHGGPADATTALPADATSSMPRWDADLLPDATTVDAPFAGDPQTCAEAAASKSYIGCDYWPTPVANAVWSIFDFAVVVSNTLSTAATVTVTGPSATHQTATVPPSGLVKIYLPWVPALKGPDQDECGFIQPFNTSVMQTGGAYHLVSTAPVTVYQFNALEYRGQGGAAGKDWSACPGSQYCVANLGPIGCYSFTNDASLLLPTSGMTGNYRVTGEHGMTRSMTSGYFAVTATQDGTTVAVTVSQTGQIIAGGGIAATSAGGTTTFALNAGDVAELVGAPSDTGDLSGSLVQADKPVQVIAGTPCSQQPLGVQACDHLESSVLPAETLGKDYVVTVPTSPGNTLVGHVVRIYGNVNGTTLTYSPSMPSGCPATINAGQVGDCGQVTQDFEVKGNNAFAVSSFMLGGQMADPMSVPAQSEGDPSMSPVVAVEQFRGSYVFLAPDDYEESYINVVAPTGTSLTLDGAPVTQTATPVGGSFGVVRVPLTTGSQNGAHSLKASQAVGIQVIGYGQYTSYQYPGGLDLGHIAPPPPPPPM